MTKEARNITILSSIGAILITLIIVWGVGSIKADRAKIAQKQLGQRQLEEKIRWEADAPKREAEAKRQKIADIARKEREKVEDRQKRRALVTRDVNDYSPGALVALSHYIRDMKIIRYDTIDYYPKKQIKLFGQRYRITGSIVAKRYYDTVDAIRAGGRGGEVITVAYDVIMKYIPTVYSEYNDPSKIYNWKIVTDNSNTTVIYPK